MEIKMAAGFENAIREAMAILVKGNNSVVYLRHPFSGFYLTYNPAAVRIIREIKFEEKKIYLSGGIV